jgi:hypothetical protein
MHIFYKFKIILPLASKAKNSIQIDSDGDRILHQRCLLILLK